MLALAIAAGSASASTGEGLPRVGRWEAEGPGGARVVFVVTASPDRQRRFAGSEIALCGAQPETGGSYYSIELDAHGRGEDHGVTGPWFPSFALNATTGVISRGFGVHDRDNHLVCSESAFHHLHAHYVGPVAVRDGEWEVHSSLGAVGTVQVWGGGTLVYQFVPFTGFTTTDPPLVCSASPLEGVVPANPVAGFPSSLISPGGLFRLEHDVSKAQTALLAGEVTMWGGFVGRSDAIGLYDGRTGPPTCVGFGSWVATWRKPFPAFTIHLPGRPPEDPVPPSGSSRHGASAEEIEQELNGYYTTNRGSPALTRGFGSLPDAFIAYQSCRQLRSRRDCLSLPTLLGADTPQSRDHIRTAITSPPRKSTLLHWIPTSHRSSPRDWYKREPECHVRSTTRHCDEYPFWSTLDGGKHNAVSLKLIRASDNRLAGNAPRTAVFCMQARPAGPQPQFPGRPTARGDPHRDTRRVQRQVKPGLTELAHQLAAKSHAVVDQTSIPADRRHGSSES